MQIDPGGLKGMVPVAGILPALVPGMMDAALLALREFGTKSFAEVVEPAVELADGMPIDEMRSMTIMRSQEFFDLWPDSKRHFMPGGRVPLPGQMFRRPDTARTLRAMVEAERKALKAGKSRQLDAFRVRGAGELTPERELFAIPAQSGEHWLAVRNAANFISLSVSDAESLVESEPNDSLRQAMELSVDE